MKENKTCYTAHKFKKVCDVAVVALERSKYKNVTDNRKNRKRVLKNPWQERNDGILRNYNWNNFSGSKEAVIAEQHNSDFVLLKKIDREKCSSKLETPVKVTCFIAKLPDPV